MKKELNCIRCGREGCDGKNEECHKIECPVHGELKFTTTSKPTETSVYIPDNNSSVVLDCICPQKPDKINYLQVGIPHCFICHKEHEDLETCIGKSLTPCTEKCGKWFRPDKWSMEFDKRFPHKGEELCETGCICDIDEIKSFIRQTIARQKSETIEVIDEELKECPQCGTEHLKVIKHKLNKLT